MAANQTAIDSLVASQILAGGLNPIAALGGYRRVYFVSPIEGDDLNDGLSPDTAVLTPQKAVELAIDYKHAAYAGADEIYGMNQLIILGAGDYLPADNASPIIEIPSWSADEGYHGLTGSGGGWGITILGVQGNGRALLTCAAAHAVPLVLVAGARGIKILGLAFYRGQAAKVAGLSDVFITDGDEVINTDAAAAAHHPNFLEIAHCLFLEDMVAEGLSSDFAIHVKDTKVGHIHHNWFGQRMAGAQEAVGVVLENDNGNPGKIRIEDNVFGPLETAGIRYVTGAAIQELSILRNKFRRPGVGAVATPFTCANAIDMPGGLAAGAQPIIDDNDFKGWAALDNTAATDAIYDVTGVATVDAGVDYLGTDAGNRISS